MKASRVISAIFAIIALIIVYIFWGRAFFAKTHVVMVLSSRYENVKFKALSASSDWFLGSGDYWVIKVEGRIKNEVIPSTVYYSQKDGKVSDRFISDKLATEASTVFCDIVKDKGYDIRII